MENQNNEKDSEHLFWNTQPVPQKFSLNMAEVGPIDAPKTVDDIKKEPYSIASTFEWWVPDMNNENDLLKIYELLRDNYVEDSNSMFRFNYSIEFLKWALTPPNYVPEWHVSVRRRRDGKTLAFISGVPLTVSMGRPRELQNELDKRDENKCEEVNAASDHEKNKKNEDEEKEEAKYLREQIVNEKLEDEKAVASSNNENSVIPDDYSAPREICEINFLCVHKQLRDKRMAPILIKEVTRRVNLHNKWQAIYTSGTHLPTPFTSAQYFHRGINIEKLFNIKFFQLPKNFTRFQDSVAMYKRAFALPKEVKTKSLRAMKPADVSQVHRLLREYLSKFDVFPVFSLEEVAHYLLPRENVVYTYVVEHNEVVTDFFSFYSLPSTVIGNNKYNQLECAYVYYYAVNTIPLHRLVQDILVIAAEQGFDVCNIVEILDNNLFIKDLLFQPGDGSLNYYFYNWNYPQTKPCKVGLVML